VEGTPIEELAAALEDRFGASETRSLDTVGPIIGAELIRSSIIIIAVGELFILLYLWYRFGFRFGTAAIVALLHDVIVVVGAFAILGYFFGVEFDALFVTAILTVVGFSVHDTIVVFDRIRENRLRHAGEPFGAIVNHSILQTIGRSINTSLTVIVTLSALLLLGPATIQTFTLALLIGIVSGTYSSIFNASQILVAWDEWAAGRKARRAPTR
jgi:preprotein translocase subunit SecF